MKRILIIDDEAMVRKGLARLLTASNYDADTAEDGLKGIENMKAAKPDLVIMDVMMPTLDGISVLHLMKEDSLLNDIPVLFLSGLDTIGDAQKALQENPAGYITKPCDPADLLKRVEALLAS